MMGYLTFLQELPHPDDGEGQSSLLLLASGPGLGVLLVLSGSSGSLISFLLLLRVLLHLSVLLVLDGFLSDGLGLGGPSLLLSDLGWILDRNILRANWNG